MKRGLAACWKEEKICKNKEEIDLWLAENSIWHYDTSQETIKVANDLYICQYSKRNRDKKFNCKARMRIRYAKDLSEAIIQTSGVHNHKRLADNGLSSPVKIKNRAMGNPFNGRSARQIQRSIQDDAELEGLVFPSLKQVQNQKSTLCRKQGFTSTLTLEDVKKYFEQNSDIPGSFHFCNIVCATTVKKFGLVDENKSFAVAFNYRSINVRENGVDRLTEQFYLVISSKKLQNRQANSQGVQVDGTYKLMTLNYPLLVAGFSDADKTFFPTYAAISSHEDTWNYKGFLEAISQAGNYEPKLLIADGATQITAACHKVFPSAKRGMCYAHVTMHLNKDLPKARIYQEACEEIKNDVAKLAMASSLLELAAASRTLYEYWHFKWGETPRLIQACEKFFRSWLFRDNYRGWYYRFAPEISMFSVSTNNGLEGTNKMIKDKYTLREQLGLSRFILVVEQLVNGWSEDPERIRPRIVPTIPQNPLSNLRKAVEKLREEKRPFVHLVRDGQHVWLIRSSSCSVDAELESFYAELMQAEESPDPDWVFSIWQRYKTLRESFFVMKYSAVFPSYISCSCPIGIKDGLGKHFLLLMETEKLIDPLPQPLEPRMKRGRKKESWSSFRANLVIIYTVLLFGLNVMSIVCFVEFFGNKVWLSWF